MFSYVIAKSAGRDTNGLRGLKKNYLLQVIYCMDGWITDFNGTNVLSEKRKNIRIVWNHALNPI